MQTSRQCSTFEVFYNYNVRSPNGGPLKKAPCLYSLIMMFLNIKCSPLYKTIYKVLLVLTTSITMTHQLKWKHIDSGMYSRCNVEHWPNRDITLSTATTAELVNNDEDPFGLKWHLSTFMSTAWIVSSTHPVIRHREPINADLSSQRALSLYNLVTAKIYVVNMLSISSIHNNHKQDDKRLGAWN